MYWSFALLCSWIIHCHYPSFKERNPIDPTQCKSINAKIIKSGMCLTNLWSYSWFFGTGKVSQPMNMFHMCTLPNNIIGSILGIVMWQYCSGATVSQLIAAGWHSCLFSSSAFTNSGEAEAARHLRRPHPVYHCDGRCTPQPLCGLFLMCFWTTTEDCSIKAKCRLPAVHCQDNTFGQNKRHLGFHRGK